MQTGNSRVSKKIKSNQRDRSKSPSKLNCINRRKKESINNKVLKESNEAMEGRYGKKEKMKQEVWQQYQGDGRSKEKLKQLLKDPANRPIQVTWWVKGSK